MVANQIILGSCTSQGLKAVALCCLPHQHMQKCTCCLWTWRFHLGTLVDSPWWTSPPWNCWTPAILVAWSSELYKLLMCWFTHTNFGTYKVGDRGRNLLMVAPRCNAFPLLHINKWGKMGSDYDEQKGWEGLQVACYSDHDSLRLSLPRKASLEFCSM